MSYSNFLTTMERIRAATPYSRIAVFKCEKPDMVDAVFADTVVSQSMIATSTDLVGVFHRGMNLTEIEDKIRNAILYK